MWRPLSRTWTLPWVWWRSVCPPCLRFACSLKGDRSMMGCCNPSIGFPGARRNVMRSQPSTPKLPARTPWSHCSSIYPSNRPGSLPSLYLMYWRAPERRPECPATGLPNRVRQAPTTSDLDATLPLGVVAESPFVAPFNAALLTRTPSTA